MSKNKNEDLYLPIVARAFAEAGLPPELGCAIARQESNWNPEARNLTGGDLERGGAFGLGQMTYKTGIALDKFCTPMKLMNPVYNAKLSAQLCRDNAKRCNNRMEDIISRYNSGKDFWKAPNVTKVHYVPRVQQFMKEYKERAEAAVKAAITFPPGDQRKM